MANKIDHQDFLRIMRLVFDIAPAVLAAFIDSRVLSKKYKSFKSFLETIKHSLYHKCISREYCCNCTCLDENHNFCSSKDDRQKDDKPFFQMFRTDKDQLNKSHQIKTGHIKKVCICQFLPNDNLSSDLDIGALGLLLTEGELLEDYQKQWLRSMKCQRNELCHLPGTTVLTYTQYEEIWRDLESAIKSFAREVGPGIHFYHSINRELKNLKTSNSTEEQIGSALQTLLAALEEKIDDKFVNHGNSITKIEEGLSLLLLDRHKSVLASAAVESMVTESEIVDMKCIVNVPKTWNELAIVQKIPTASTDQMTQTDNFCIITADKGSIRLRIAIKRNVFKNTEELHSVILSLLQKITNAGDIDVNVPAFVSLGLQLWTEENKGNHDNSKSQTLNVDFRKEELKEQDTSFSFTTPRQIVDNQDIPLEASTIGSLMQLVVDVFPDIIREWLLKYTTEENINANMKGHVVLGTVRYTSLKDSNFPTILAVVRSCRIHNIQYVYDPRYTQITISDSDKSPTDDILRMETIYNRIVVTGSSIINEEERCKILQEIREIFKRFDEYFNKKHNETYVGRFEYLCKYWGFAQDMYSVLDKFGLSFFYPHSESTANFPRRQYIGSYSATTMKSTDSGHFSDGSGRKKKLLDEDGIMMQSKQRKRPGLPEIFFETGSSET